VKLTTTKLFIGLFVITGIGVVAGLLWLSGHEAEDGKVRGPATLLSKIKARQRQIAVEEGRSNVKALESATHDLSLSGAAAK
jgi:hypothetical protein